jgi:hypothetical protein
MFFPDYILKPFCWSLIIDYKFVPVWHGRACCLLTRQGLARLNEEVKMLAAQ